MPLTPGKRIGSYEIAALVGEGGMGQVYRARDTRLDREVAIKVLPDAVAADADRLARFEREAKALAALNHPHIAQIYGLEGHALVMEFVGGDDLSTVIARHPMSLTDALPIARQIADALAAAHAKGIIHRDLKPANIKVTPAGDVKILDFGLAKAMATDAEGSASGNAANSPTLTARGTQLGMILGTAAYMAPEQARGKAVDQRADVWAFGAVLFEMLSGKRLFEGAEITDVLAAVLKTDPDWSQLPASVPAAIRRLLRRCLEKDPGKRLTAMADARLELDEADPEPSAAAGAPAPQRRRWLPLVGAAAAAAIVTAAAMLLLRPPTPASTAGVARLSIVSPPGQELYPDSTQVAISPDGTMVAFVVGGYVALDANQLWVRRLDSLAATRIEAGDGAFLPFWKPDSTKIGFFAGRKLKTVAVSGGRADVVADAPFGRGAAWNQSDVILFAGDASGTLSRVSANGGDPTRVTTLDASRKESAHRFPVFLPDGDHFLYAALPGHDGKFNVFAGSLGDSKLVLPVGVMGNSPTYVDPGWLLYGRQGVLVAQPFDPRSLKTTGDPVPIADDPSAILDPSISYTAGHMTSASSHGALAYYSGASTKTKAVWLDSTGRIAGSLAVKPEMYSTVRLSPDGTQAMFVRSVSPTESSVWLIDVARASTSAFSKGGGRNESPVWSPDGAQVMFSSDRDGPQDFFVRGIADASPERPLYRSDVLFKTPSAWTTDQKSILFYQLQPMTSYDVFSVPSTGKGAPELVAGGPGRELGAVISPNGQWLGFLAEDTSRFELYVQSWPQGGRRIQASSTSASMWWWTKDSRQLVYMTGDLHELWRVDLLPGPPGSGPHVGTPVRLGNLPPGLTSNSIDAMPDRQRFLALLPDQVGVASITVVQNWQAALGKR